MIMYNYCSVFLLEYNQKIHVYAVLKNWKKLEKTASIG